MPGIVEFPTVVRDAVARYGGFFANDCQRRHFAEYLTGLFVAERKTVLGIHEAFAHTTDQSCLNRFLTEVAWDAERSISDGWSCFRRIPLPATATRASSPSTTPSSTATGS